MSVDSIYLVFIQHMVVRSICFASRVPFSSVLLRFL